MPNRWQGGLLLLSLLLSLPLLTIVASWWHFDPALWRHLFDTVLNEYVTNSVLLTLGVGLGSTLVGAGLAWCMVHYRFFGHRLLSWLLLLPLAMPAYIIAYTYTGVLDFAGPVQSSLRDMTGWVYGDYWFPEIRSLGGAILMMTLVLYPYVYLLARAAFIDQSSSLREASRSAGLSGWQHVRQIALPMARPAIFTGAALAMMEALADYGTVQYFGVQTFTTGIFRTWFGLGSEQAAAQLSALLCTVVLVLLVLEQHARRRVRYFHLGQARSHRARVIFGWRGMGLFALCLLPPLAGFLLPVAQLTYWSRLSLQSVNDDGFWQLVFNSFWLAALAAVLIVILALLFGYAQRLNNNPLTRIQVRLAGLGYAVPGTVIAVGVMLPLTWFDHQLNAFTETWFAVTPGLVLSGSVIALLLAYCVRFLSVALHNVEAGLGRITPSMDNASRSLGCGPGATLRRVHVPIMRASVVSALLLVFVDVMKELPATLILRPFNFNTLAVRAYELASDERLIDAALPAISIVAVGVVPVVLLTRAMTKNEVKAN